jgi:hypothetical protein
MRGEKIEGSTTFNAQRFEVAREMGYTGWAIWADGDMLCRADIAELMDYANTDFDVIVAKHDYKTKHPVKFLGQPNADYPRKNWSSLILWNCGHYANRRLTPELVTESPGSFLHRFQWLRDEQIGELPVEWNTLIGEQDSAGASLLHYTLGSPGFTAYRNCDASEHFHRAYKAMTHMENG